MKRQYTEGNNDPPNVSDIAVHNYVRYNLFQTTQTYNVLCCGNKNGITTKTTMKPGSVVGTLSFGSATDLRTFLTQSKKINA